MVTPDPVRERMGFSQRSNHERRPATRKLNPAPMGPSARRRASMRSSCGHPVEAVLLRLADADVDQPAGAAAVHGAVVAWVEVDLLQQLGGDDRAEPAEVKEDGDVGPPDEHRSVPGGRAAHGQVAAQRRRARHAGEREEGLERVAVGAGDERDLALVERALGDLPRGPVALDLDLEDGLPVGGGGDDGRRGGLGREAEHHARLLAGGEHPRRGTLAGARGRRG